MSFSACFVSPEFAQDSALTNLLSQAVGATFPMSAEQMRNALATISTAMDQTVQMYANAHCGNEHFRKGTIPIYFTPQNFMTTATREDKP